jgi:hypothetical protein
MCYDGARNESGKTMKMKMHPVVKWLAMASIGSILGGCGVLAAPCRIASAVIKVVPVVGHAAALPTDACAAVIDP